MTPPLEFGCKSRLCTNPDHGFRPPRLWRNEISPSDINFFLRPKDEFAEQVKISNPDGMERSVARTRELLGADFMELLRKGYIAGDDVSGNNGRTPPIKCRESIRMKIEHG